MTMSKKAQDKELVVLDKLEAKEFKTKVMAELIEKQKEDSINIDSPSSSLDKSNELAEEAIEILGEDTIRLAHS